MKHFSKHIFAIVLLLALIVTNANASEFIFFHTSDVHGSIAPHADLSSTDGEKRLIGGYAVLRNLF